jgi:hypothetical protein
VDGGEKIDLRGLALDLTMRQTCDLLSGRGHFAGVATMLGIDTYL